MRYTIAVFNSRFSTLNFSNLLRMKNIPNAVINTPQSLGRFCGISIKFLTEHNERARGILQQSNLQNQFVGFFPY